MELLALAVATCRESPGLEEACIETAMIRIADDACALFLFSSRLDSIENIKGMRLMMGRTL